MGRKLSTQLSFYSHHPTLSVFLNLSLQFTSFSSFPWISHFEALIMLFVVNLCYFCLSNSFPSSGNITHPSCSLNAPSCTLNGWFECELPCSSRPCTWPQLMADGQSELIIWIFELETSASMVCSLVVKLRWSMVAAGNCFPHHMLAASLKE